MRADEYLKNKSLDFELVEQDNPTKKCSAAAEERGLDTDQIVKSLIVKQDGELFHVCIPGDRTLSEKRFGEHRMADPEESFSKTGQESGTVHPFSSELKHFTDKRIFEKNIVSFTVGTKTEAIKIKPENFREGLESAQYEYEIRDLVVSNEKEVNELMEKGIGKEDAKFVAEKGYRTEFHLFQPEFRQERIVKLFMEIDRHGINVSEQNMREILERADNETHLQKLVEHFADKKELPENKEFDLEETVKNVLKDNQEAVKDLKQGKDSSINYLIGQVMQQSQGKADASEVREEIKSEI